MPELAYLNGVFGPIEDMKVSIEDRGFQFADGVYEVIVFHGRRPLMLDEHMRRLENSCREIRLNLDIHKPGLREVIHEGVQRAGFEDTMVYVQLTRGPAPRNHVYPADPDPTVVMTFKAKPVMPAGKREKGVTVMTVADYRWAKCHVKSVALLANVLAKNDAIAAGFDDALFVGPGGLVREATSANVFAIKSDNLLTPPEDESILHGITRKLVLACAAAIGLPVLEQPLFLENLYHADEVFISSTTIDILPVAKVDGRRIAAGRPGPWTGKLYQQMQTMIRDRQN